MSHASVARRAALIIGASSALAAFACSRDHSALEQEPTGSGGSGGVDATSTGVGIVSATTGDAGLGGSGGANDGGGPSSSSGVGGDGDGGARPEEPDGLNRVVVVHGVADRERLGFCFATSNGEGLDVPPFPLGGLDFAGVADVDAESMRVGISNQESPVEAA